MVANYATSPIALIEDIYTADVPGTANLPRNCDCELAEFVNATTGMATQVIQVRAFEFACRLVRLAQALSQRGFGARHIASQLVTAGTSVGANCEEAEEGQTKADFIAKLSISRKEARETIFWLRLALATNIVTEAEIAWELDEARQLRAMLIAAIKKAQSSTSRG